MKRKTILAVIALMAAFALAMTGCGSEKPEETTAAATDTTAAQETLSPAEPLGLTDWTMNATTWSSPNGATVNLTATPNGYTEGQSVSFCVRLEGEEVATVPCAWDGSVYTASADLNADDGYCYYVLLTAADGTTSEVAVNVPTAPTDESLINLKSSLNAYCTVVLDSFALEGDKLSIHTGSAQIQLPTLTLAQDAVSCQKAVLVLSYDNEDVAQSELTVPAADESGLCQVDLAGTSFTVPSEMEDDHQLSVRLDVTLSNGHAMSVPGGSWRCFDGTLVLAVG